MNLEQFQRVNDKHTLYNVNTYEYMSKAELATKIADQLGYSVTDPELAKLTNNINRLLEPYIVFIKESVTMSVYGFPITRYTEVEV